MESLSEKAAYKLAAEAHVGQVDKAGRTYITHLSKVARSPRLITGEEKAAGWLHDSIEDTWVDIPYLERAGFGVGVVMMVDTLTRREGEEYFEYIARVSRFDATRRIKLADIDDHLEDTSSLGESHRIRYARAKNYLLLGSVDEA